MTYKAESTPPWSPVSRDDAPVVKRQDSPRRHRTVKTALALLDHANLLPHERPFAVRRIRAATQPNVEAKRIIKHHEKRALGERGKGEVDLSDITELEVTLIRRDGDLWPPQSTMLQKIAWQIVEEGMTRVEFEAAAATLLTMPQVLPKSFREAEARYWRTSD